jgi:hypothetical protein
MSLGHKIVTSSVLHLDKFHLINERLGNLEEFKIYVAEPYIFLGGDGSVESYTIADLWVYLEIISEIQGVAELANQMKLID